MCHRQSQNKLTAWFRLPPLSLFTTRQPNPHCKPLEAFGLFGAGAVRQCSVGPPNVLPDPSKPSHYHRQLLKTTATKWTLNFESTTTLTATFLPFYTNLSLKK
jgi:hypothetical protein